MIDSSAQILISSTPKSNESFAIKLNLLEDFKIFENKIISSLNINRKNFIFNEKAEKSFNYQIEKSSVHYGEIIRDGIFGKYFLSRTLTMKGSFNYLGEINFTREFSFVYLDTIKYNSINEIENSSIPITQGKVPAEPFFTNIWEPVILLSSAGVAVYLFFSVRSK